MVDKLREVYESDPLAMASAYGVEAVDPEETVQAVKDVAQFGWESLPGVGTYYTVQDITEELEQENPNYLKIGLLAGTEVIGLIPGIGDAAANMIRKGADMAKGSDNVVDATSRIPQVPNRKRAEDKTQQDLSAAEWFKQTSQINFDDFDFNDLNLKQSEIESLAKVQLGDAAVKEEEERVQRIIEARIPQITRALSDMLDTKNKSVVSLDDYKDAVYMTETSSTVKSAAEGLANQQGLLSKLGPSMINDMRISDRVDSIAEDIDNPLLIEVLTSGRDRDLVEWAITENAIRKSYDKFMSTKGMPRSKDVKPQMSNEEYDELFLNLDEADNPKEWQQGAKALIKKGRVADPSIKTPELEDSTRLLLENKITREEHLANVDKYKPVNAWDALPRDPSDKALVFALDSNKRTDGLFVLDGATTEALGVSQSPLSVGMRFNGRLDIPAYTNNDTWIVAGTSPAVKGAGGKGSVTTYAKAIHYVADGDKPVKFVASPKTSEAIGTGEKNKTGYATVSGIVGDLDVDAIRAKAAEYLNDPEWTQVGFDPRRQGGFYVRAGENKHVPVREATEVIQIGPLVLARNAKLDFEYSGYNEGGMAMDEQMDAVFKSSRTGYAVGGSVDLDSVPDNTVGMDPVSGNEIPLGSLPEEVRDDIPAQLSEGEYVVPADVVRYYGVKFFEDLRADAKFGYQDMEENGRIGGEPAGMEMVDPEDDMMFDISELEVMEVPDEEPVGAFFGGFFGSKKKEPTVRERFDAAAKRDNSPAAIQKRVQAMNAQNRAAGYDTGRKSAPAAKPKSSGPSIAEQINFGGDYEDTSSGGSIFGDFFGGGDKEKKKQERSAAGSTVRRAYTGAQEDDGQTFAEKINFGGNYNQGGYAESGGYALSPGDEGYDEMGSLGLGSEGLPLGTGEDATGGAVEMVAYVNDEGRVIYIMHINGVPQNEIPAGFYPRTEEENTQTSSGTGSQPVAQVVREVGSDYNDRLDDMNVPMPEGVDYASLTTEEMFDMLEEQQSAKMDIITAGAAAVNPIMGLFLKGAMVHQARQLEREIERRLDGELTTQERTQLEGLLKQSKEGKPGLIRRIYGALKDEFTGEEEEAKGPEAYTPEVAAGSVTKALSPDTMSQIEQAAKDAADPTQSQEYLEAARKAKEAREAAAAAAAAQAAQPTAPTSYADDTGYSAAGTGDVLSAMKERGASEAAITAAENEAAKIKSNLESTAKGGKMGFKKGGLASKKKK